MAASTLHVSTPPILDMAAPREKRSDMETGNRESDATRIERLGRARPEKFRSTWEEVGFCFSIVMSQVLTVRSIFPLVPSQINHRD
jgi:hypothetical protein